MKSFLPLLCLLALILTGCESSSKPTLQIFIWSDYITPEVIEKFKSENDCHIVIDTFDSNESMYAKLKLGANSYDLIFPSNYFLDILRKQNMIQPIDKALIPNYKNLDETYLKLIDKEDLEYAIPYMLSTTGIIFRNDKVKDFTPSWKVFANTDLKGRMTMLNDLREVIGAALQVLGYSINTVNPQEINVAADLVLQWKQNLAKFEGEQYKNGVASGEYLVAQGYAGDALQVMVENKNVGFSYAEEGTAIAIDFAVIPSNAQNKELACKFIDYLLKPEVSAENIVFTNFLSPNAEAYKLLPEEMQNSKVLFPPKEVLNKSEMIRDLGKENLLYNQAWDKIKAGR